MDKGKISDILKSPYGFHIILVEEKWLSRKLKFEQVKAQIVIFHNN